MTMIPVDRVLYPPYYTGSHGGQGRTIDAAEEFCFSVIKIAKTGTLKKIGWRITAVSSPVLGVKVSVETCANTEGQPVATTNAGKTLYAPGAESAEITSFTAGVRFDAINGTTGISVTKGDIATITFRCTSYTSGNVSVGQDTGATFPGMPTLHFPYEGTYLNSTWAAYERYPGLILEYDDGFVLGVPSYISVCPTQTTDTWSSSSNPDRRGLKFSVPYKCTLAGAYVQLDTDAELQIILYDSDEYTVMSGFPITINANQRPNNGGAWTFIEFPTEPTILADMDYRLVVLPTTTTSITSYYATPTGDGSFSGLSSMPMGTKCVYTTFNGTPTAGSHAWTDSTTSRHATLLEISNIIIDYPDAGNVTADDTVDGVTGTYHEATAAEVQSGVQFGAGGTEYTGTYTGGGGGGLPILGGSIVR